MKKRLLICLVLLVALLMTNLAISQAATTRDLSFTLSDDRSSYIITDCKETANGQLNINASYEGLPVVEIGRDAFLNCTELTSVTISSKVKTIGWYAFSGCTGLTKVTIPASVTTLDWFAFSGCTGLTEVTVKDGLTYIDAAVFSGCTKLNKVTLGNTIKTIGWSAFKGCSKLSSINIPHSVTSIDRYAFYGCDSLTTVTYCGTEGEWNAITKGEGNSALGNATLQFHSYEKGVCKFCLETYCSNNGHDMKQTAEAVAPTCEAAGKTAVLTCANGCGKTEGGVEIPAAGHDWKQTAAAVAPTCETAGKTAVETCAVCGTTKGGVEIPAIKHDMQETEPAVDATCETAGKTAVLTCANGCGKTIGGDEIPALGHNYVDGTCDACGAQEPVTRLDICGVSRSKNLALEGTILVYANVAFMDSTATTNAEGLTKEYVMENGRLLFWSLADMPADAEAAVLGTETHCAEFDKTSVYKGIQEYYAYSHGIPAKEYNDTIYYRTYIVVDGVEYYGDIIEYSVVTYCENQLKKTTASANKMKPLLAAMLNYGAAAQEYFGYKTDAKANACLQTYVNQGLLDAAHLTMNWSDSYLTALVEADAAMTVNFAVNEAKRTSKNLGLEGAVETKLTFAYKLNGNAGSMMPADGNVTFYYWTAGTYNALKADGKVLTKDNADYIKTGDEITQTHSTKYGYEYYAMSEGIPAKQLGESIYTAAVFTMADGTEYCSGVTVYSAEEYASGQISKTSAAANLKALAKWMVIYGEAAYTYFNS